MSQDTTHGTDESLTGDYDCRLKFDEKGCIPPEVRRVRISEDENGGYHWVEYLDRDGNVVMEGSRATEKIRETLNRDNTYTVVMPKRSVYPGGIRTTHAFEAIACFKKAVQSRDTWQAKMALHNLSNVVLPDKPNETV